MAFGFIPPRFPPAGCGRLVEESFGAFLLCAFALKSTACSRIKALLFCVSLGGALGLRASETAPARPSSAPRVDFSRSIQPILVDRCYSCHGPDKQKGGLRLDRQADAMKGGDSGKVIQPGRSDQSLLIRYVAGLDPETVMPPKGDRLTTNQVGLLRGWIEAGADWPEATLTSQPAGTASHWAFQAPLHPSVPSVQNRRSVRNSIDSFVLARLEREQITPSAEADGATLVRRLHLDLIGLPPTPERVRAFQNDQRLDAWERLVDELLNSPHFGERWGRHWLDLARYADTDGYQIDHARPYAYAYRNWVIEACNRDLPFDQFTVQQIAGDLLPEANFDTKAATGFHRNTLTNNEDGVDREEFRCRAKVDRVSSTGAVWLGLTVGCAECHSHKYDPISQREFYQLYSFFNQAEEQDISAPKSLRQPPSYQPTMAPTFIELTNCPKTFVHIRGDFLRRGEEVQPGVLSALHPFRPRGSKPDRLDLARWLVDPANPLTARVAVNHFWKHLFGRGLVATVEDFGLRGDAPSHPELLDWLATEFLECGWSRKEMIKLIVSSATYRQSSGARVDLKDRDPSNLLLARQSRFRLESEIVRDLSLAAGGLLNGTIGGPSFHPRTREDFKALGAAGAFTWADSSGPELYRRGLYVFAQRTVPYPVSTTFDAANASESCPRRERSNTPLQALTLLNNEVFVECGQALGQRLSRLDAASPRERMRYGFEVCLGRQPTAEELNRLQRLYDETAGLACQSPENSAKVVGNYHRSEASLAEAATWVAVGQVLMNLDEFTIRE